MLNPFGINPIYPFAQVFIMCSFHFPEPLLWVFWYLFHQFHIFIEFHGLLFQNIDHLPPFLKTMLFWFKPKSFWQQLFQNYPDYIILQFRRTVQFDGVTFQSMPSVNILHSNKISILELEEDYSEIQHIRNKLVIDCCAENHKEFLKKCSHPLWENQGIYIFFFWKVYT